MKAETRSLIRHLYFVDHLPVGVIARELRLSRRTVHRALVVAGGARTRTPVQSQPKENDS